MLKYKFNENRSCIEITIPVSRATNTESLMKTEVVLKSKSIERN